MSTTTNDIVPVENKNNKIKTINLTYFLGNKWMEYRKNKDNTIIEKYNNIKKSN